MTDEPAWQIKARCNRYRMEAERDLRLALEAISIDALEIAKVKIEDAIYILGKLPRND